MTKKLFPSETRLIPTSQIEENPQNPRSEIGDVSDLEASIKAHGLLQPITVRPVGKKYQVVAGSRRFNALKNLGFKSIKCEVRPLKDKEAFEIATTENVSRKNMSEVDECLAVAKMVEDGMDIHTVASHFGRHPRWVIGRVKMAKLGDEAMEMLRNGEITLGHAEALTMADDDKVEHYLHLAQGYNPEMLKNFILNERKNLAKANFYTKTVCKNCQKKSIKQQDIFGDISECYCLDGKCYAEQVAKRVQQLREEFKKDHFKECPEEDQSDFKCGYYWVSIDNVENECADKKLKAKWLKANGYKPYYLINESDASYEFKWNLHEYKKDEDDSEEATAEAAENREIDITNKAEELADEEEEGIIKDRIRNLLLAANDEMCAMILDLLDESLKVETENEEGEKDTEYESYLEHIGEGENGLTPKQTVLDKLTAHYSTRYQKNQARNFFGLGDESEYKKRVEANKVKAKEIIDKETEETDEEDE